MKKIVKILVGKNIYKKFAWTAKRFGLSFLLKNMYSLLFKNECLIPNNLDSRGLFVRLGTTDMDLYDEVMLSDELNLNIDTDPDIILDCGAHIGLVSINFAVKYPNSLIYAIEAEETNYAILKKNSLIYTNIFPIHRAIWKNNSYLEIEKKEKNNWEYYVKEVNFHTVNQGISIDNFLNTYNLTHIDIMKMDVEGAELEVFNHSDNWIEKINMIIIETHDRFKPGCKESVERATRKFFPKKYHSGEKLILSK